MDEGQHKDGELIKIGTLRGVTEDFWLVSIPRSQKNFQSNFRELIEKLQMENLTMILW